jgi:hypothetical protein
MSTPAIPTVSTQIPIIQTCTNDYIPKPTDVDTCEYIETSYIIPGGGADVVTQECVTYAPCNPPCGSQPYY